MRMDPLSPAAVFHALELYGPQARPYNFDDCFDCWGLVRRIFDHLDDGFEMDGELQGPDDPEVANWQRFTDAAELVPGDLLTSHPHASGEFHTVIYCGRVDGLDLVYDSSSRGEVPLFLRREGAWRFVEARALFTRYARATETTGRLRNDGGAYLRLWDDRCRYHHKGLHERLLAAGAGEGGAAGRDLVALRRAAGLSELPFYCIRRLPRGAAGREVYDNQATRRLDYYVPGGAPVLDDDHAAAAEAAARPQLPRPPARLRPPAPRLTSAPFWIVREGPVTVEWEFDPASEVDGCRVEVWEETWDLWKHRLLRRDLDVPVTAFVVPPEVLHDDSRFAVVVWARGPGGFSGTALAPFLYRPAPGNPLVEYDPIRPEDLRPDGGETVPAGRGADLAWRIREPERSQAGATVTVFEDACLLDGAEPILIVTLTGADALGCHVTVPAGLLRPGHTYAWYVLVMTSDGRTAFAPAEGVFRVAGEG